MAYTAHRADHLSDQSRGLDRVRPIGFDFWTSAATLKGVSDAARREDTARIRIVGDERRVHPRTLVNAPQYTARRGNRDGRIIDRMD